jgi:hypothetical protein
VRFGTEHSRVESCLRLTASQTLELGSAIGVRNMSRKKQSNGRGRRKPFSFGKRQSRSALSFEHLESRLAMAVVINEFLAENNSGIRDFAGERHDWIELKNTGESIVDISGWYLTDDALNFTKWQIPATVETQSLDPGEVLLVFASDKNGVFSGELHADFKLSLEESYLGLTQANGTTVEHAFSPYPAQVADVSYGPGRSTATTSNETLVGANSALRVISPTSENAARDDHWRGIGFDDSSWLSGTRSVGFDRNSDGSNLAPFIGRILTTGEMNSNDATPQYSAYVRYAFNVADKDQLTSLTLSLRFDDGFIAYINGREVKRVNFGEDFSRPQPQWDSFAGNHVQGSSATAANRVGEVVDAVAFDLTPYLSELVNGTNVLAFHGVNSNSTTSASTNRLDFLIEPVLTATRATDVIEESYMTAPTPGDDNGVGVLGLVADTQFSHDRGFYDAAFNLVISTATVGATIRYTTDGSVPTLTNGVTYSGPIAVDPATIPNGHRGVVMIRAAAFKDGFASTNVDTQSYVFLDKVIFQNGSGLPASGPWGYDKDGDGNSGYLLDHDDKDWAMDPDIRNAVGAAQLIDDLRSIPSMSIVMDWDDLFGATPLPGTPPQTGTTPGASSAVAPAPEGIYIVGRSSERHSSLEYFNPNAPDDQFQIDAAIEIQGHSSPTRWNTDKLSFQVKFKPPFGETELDYPLFVGTPDGEHATTEFDTLVLDAGFNYTWTHANVNVQTSFARYVSDQVTADLQNLASGDTQAAHGRYVHLYLNGMYWGLYNVHERTDDSFAAEYFGGDKDDYLIVKHSTNEAAPPAGHKYTWVEGGITAENAYQSLLIASRAVDANPTSATLYQAVADVLDIEQFIDYMIVHMYAGNEADWPHNNWYGTFNHLDLNGKWRFHSWDQEHAFPTSDNSDLFNQFSDLTDYASEDFEGPGELFHNLIGNDSFRLTFGDRVQELMYSGGALTPAVAQAVYEARLTEIDRAINGESARWGDNRHANDPFTRQDFIDVNINNTTGDLKAVVPDFFPVRTGAVLGDFDSVGWIPSLDAPLFSQYGGEIASGFDLTLSLLAGSPGGAVIYYTLDGNDPRDMTTNQFSSSAIPYTGPIDLADGAQVKARIYFNNSGSNNDWSPVVDKTFTLEDPLPLRIVEVMYNPSGPEETLEYFELLNTGDETIELAGVQITEFSTGGFTFSAGMLNPGERIVVVKDHTAFGTAYPTASNIAAGVFSGSLANEGELISLRGPLGELLQSFTYGDGNVAGWPTTPDGSGYSLEYIGSLTAGENPLDGASADPFDDPVNWRASLQLNGSPGTDGELNEPDSADFDGDGDVDGRDFLAWQRGFGTSNAVKEDGDADNEGSVNGVDLTIWQDQYGTVPAVSAIAEVGESQSVPSLLWFPIGSTSVDSISFDLIEPTSFVAENPRDDAFALTAPVDYMDDDFGDIAVCRDLEDATGDLDELLFGELI